MCYFGVSARCTRRSFEIECFQSIGKRKDGWIINYKEKQKNGMKKVLIILVVVALMRVMSISALASGWETHSFSGTTCSITRYCSYASLTATYSNSYKQLSSSDGYYKSSNYEKAISLSFPTTTSRTVTAYVSVGGGTLGIAS